MSNSRRRDALYPTAIDTRFVPIAGAPVSRSISPGTIKKLTLESAKRLLKLCGSSAALSVIEFLALVVLQKHIGPVHGIRHRDKSDHPSIWELELKGVI
jgi:hypothetical protein